MTTAERGEHRQLYVGRHVVRWRKYRWGSIPEELALYSFDDQDARDVASRTGVLINRAIEVLYVAHGSVDDAINFINNENQSDGST